MFDYSRRMIFYRRLIEIGALSLCALLLTTPADGRIGRQTGFTTGNLTIEELLGETVSVEELEQNIESALATAQATGDAKALLEPLDVIVRNVDLLPSPDVFEKFTEALLIYGRAEDLSSRTPPLLKYAGIEFNPSATAKLNLGIMLASYFGGADFDDLRPLTRVRDVDLDWLIPALGKTGREKALPLIESYAANAAIERAVALGLAHAGDTHALQKVLAIQDRDISSLKRSGSSILYHLLMGDRRQAERGRSEAAKCRRRIRQVEQLFDSLGYSVIPLLIDQAVHDGSPAAMQYLFKKMDSIPADRLSGLLGLAEHPEPFTKKLVLQRMWDSGDVELRDDILERLRGMATAPGGYDRLTAITLLCRMSPNEGFDLLQHAIARESNVAVRIALENLRESKKGFHHG